LNVEIMIPPSDGNKIGGSFTLRKNCTFPDAVDDLEWGPDESPCRVSAGELEAVKRITPGHGSRLLEPSGGDGFIPETVHGMEQRRRARTVNCSAKAL
jgi:hypothetical protein